MSQVVIVLILKLPELRFYPNLLPLIHRSLLTNTICGIRTMVFKIILALVE